MSVSDGSNDDPIESSIYSPEMNEADPRDACERSGHVAVGFENELLIWGGSRCALPTFSYNDFCDPNILWVYNTLNDVYTRREILGVPPRGTSGSAAVIHDGSLYIFGGFISSIFSGNMGYSNLLHRVDLTTNKLTWKEIQPKGERPLPCDKLASWVYGDKLYFFGGFGHWVPGSDSSWVRDESERGWNNQLVCYNTKTNEWEWPRTYGPKPRPRAAHSAALSGHTVYIFGGRLESVRNDELHSINMNTMTWSGDLKSTMKGAHWPCGRSWHTFTFVSPTVAFIQGGMSTTDQTLDDIWKLTFQDDAIECEMQPTHIIEGGAACPILWHQSAYFPKGNEIITVGGMKELHGTDSTNHYNKLCTLRLSPKSLFRLSLDALEKIDNVPESEFKTLPAQLKATIRRRLLSTLVYDIEDSDAFYDMDDLHGFGLPYDDIEDFYHEGDDDDDDYDDYDDMYGVFDDDYDDDGAND